MLTVYIDFKSPASYLAINPVLALVERHGIVLEWKAFRSSEREVPTITDNPLVANMHWGVRAASRRTFHQKYASHQGINLQFPASAGNTDLALGALALISGDPLSFINAAFAAYWTDHAVLNGPTVIAHLISETIGENFVFDEKNCIDALESSQAEAKELGIVDAPAFIIQDQLLSAESTCLG